MIFKIVKSAVVSISHDKNNTNQPTSAHLSPLQNGFGQVVWLGIIATGLLLALSCIDAWLSNHPSYQSSAKQAFALPDALFIFFMVILCSMAIRRCLWIDMTKRTTLTEAVEMGWLFERLSVPESDWRAYILKHGLTVFIADRPLPEPTASDIKAKCFCFFKFMFGYNKVAFWAAVGQKRACFHREQVETIIAKASSSQEAYHPTEADHQALLDSQAREQALLRQVAEQAEKIVHLTGRDNERLAQIHDLTRQLDMVTADKKSLEEYNKSTGKGNSEKAMRAKFHREAMLLGAICLPMIYRKIAEAQRKIENGCPVVKYSIQRLDVWFQQEWPNYPQYHDNLLKVIASKAHPDQDIESKRLPILTREFLFELLREAGFAAGKGEKEEGVEDELWLADDIEDDEPTDF